MSAQASLPSLLTAALFFGLLLASLSPAGADEDTPTVSIRAACTPRHLDAPGAPMEFGTAVANVGDVTGDGIDDLAVGAPRTFVSGAAAGAVLIYAGPLGEDVDASAPAAMLTGDDQGDHAGLTVVALGDLNGDGANDLAVGAPLADPPGSGPTGTVYIHYGPIVEDRALTDSDVVIHGTSVAGRFGNSIANTGDVTGDGHADLLIGAPFAKRNGVFTGLTYLFHGPLSGTYTADQAQVRFYGPHPDGSGYTVAAADTDGDGTNDLLIGAPYRDGAVPGREEAGAVSIIRDATLLAGDVALTTADATITGATAGGRLGRTLTVLPDQDGDGRADLLTGSPYYGFSGEDSGALFLFANLGDGTIAQSTARARLHGAAAEDRAGWHAAPVGDLDDDGHPDIAIGAPHTGGMAKTGTLYIVPGGPSLTGNRALAASPLIIQGVARGDVAGFSAAGGDFDADGEPDLVVGIPGSDRSGGNAGSVAILDRSSWSLDSDLDGLPDDCEMFWSGTDPSDPDTDGDRISDGAEVDLYGTDPHDRDTDGDLVGDGTEIEGGSDPLDPLSVPSPAGPVHIPVRLPWDSLPVTDDEEPLL